MPRIAFVRQCRKHANIFHSMSIGNVLFQMLYDGRRRNVVSDGSLLRESWIFGGNCLHINEVGANLSIDSFLNFFYRMRRTCVAGNKISIVILSIWQVAETFRIFTRAFELSECRHKVLVGGQNRRRKKFMILAEITLFLFRCQIFQRREPFFKRG